MGFVGSALLDPFRERVFLSLSELFVRLGRRHNLVFVLGINVEVEVGLLEVARDNGFLFNGSLANV